MIEISIVLFSLLVEGFVVLLTVISVTVFIQKKRKNKDREAIKKLVEQIRVQSGIRLKKTGSFLSEKYNLEGNDLDKAVKKIDKAEKKFMHKLINVYHKRDTHGLIAMDASVAELIETYKELSPVISDAEAHTDIVPGHDEQSEAVQQEIANLQEQNKNLTEELSITKETMGNMIAEFGNMFGGGKENELENIDVIEKYLETSGNTEEIAHVEEPDSGSEPETMEQVDSISIEEEGVDDDIQLDEVDTAEAEAVEVDTDDLSENDDLIESAISKELEVEHVEVDQRDEAEKEQEAKKQAAKPDEKFDEGIDDLIDGIDLSDESL